MICRKCPHHVRHGQASPDGRDIEFHDRCGLRMKENEQLDCSHYPFPKLFDHQDCEIYIATFKSTGHRNNVVPTSDIQYSEKLASSSITDMELL